MAKYLHTGKINFPKTILAFAIAIPLSILIGWVYGFLMELCPFIILDLLIIVVIFVLLIATATGLSKLGSIRNKGVKFILALVVSFLGWYSAWAYLVNNHFFGDFLDFGDTFSHIARYLNHNVLSIGRRNTSIDIEGTGMWILSGIETLLFMIPIIVSFTASKDYYCEKCQKFNLHQQLYVHAPENPGMLDSAEYTGNFKELAKFPRTDKVPDVITPEMIHENIYHMDVSYCRECHGNGVVNISKGSYKVDDKKKVEFASKQKVLKDTWMDNESVLLFIDPNKEGSEYTI